MAGETTITLVGNMTADPELRFTANGNAVANFTVASTARRHDPQSGGWQDGDTMFLRCSVWRQYAEHVAESLTKGTRVIVQGRLKSRSYEDRDGNKRTVFEVDVDEVGPALRFVTATLEKPGDGSARPKQGAQPGDGWDTQQQWNGQGSGWDQGRTDEPPF